jgi:hypothetical protein
MYNELMLSTLGRFFDLYGSCAAVKRGKGSRKCCFKMDLPAGKTSTPS